MPRKQMQTEPNFSRKFSQVATIVCRTIFLNDFAFTANAVKIIFVHAGSLRLFHSLRERTVDDNLRENCFNLQYVSFDIAVIRLLECC